MKKLFLFLMLFGMISCYNTDRVFDIVEPETSVLPETEVYVQGKLVSNVGTKGGSSLYEWPYDSKQGWESARFSIRIDASLPGYTNQSSDLYFGRPAFKDGKNRGRVSSTYPYGHYNDRDYDYYKKAKVTGNNIGMFRYLYDEKGLKTQFAILEAPSVVDILSDEVDDLQAEIDANKNVAKNTVKMQSVNSLIALGKDYLDTHVLWYVVKEVALKGGWHVNGIIADTVIGKPNNIPENIEVDIHQQKHLDWNEIKTSVHIRTDVDSIKIRIPLAFDDICEQDDFDIRVFKAFYKENEYSDVTVTITHDENGITIVISDIQSALIEKYKNQFGDGLTVEVFSYTNLDSISAWQKIKKSHVVSTGKFCTIVGQVTSAYNDTIVPMTIMEP